MHRYGPVKTNTCHAATRIVKRNQRDTFSGCVMLIWILNLSLTWSLELDFLILQQATCSLQLADCSLQFAVCNLRLGGCSLQLEFLFCLDFWLNCFRFTFYVRYQGPGLMKHCFDLCGPMSGIRAKGWWLRIQSALLVVEINEWSLAANVLGFFVC